MKLMIEQMIRDMVTDEQGYTQSWAILYDSGAYYVNGNYSVLNMRGGTHTTLIRRSREGVIVSRKDLPRQQPVNAAIHVHTRLYAPNKEDLIPVIIEA